MAGDIHFASVTSLLLMNGTNGSTTFTDSAPATAPTWTAFNQAQLTTTNPKFGTACGTFDGSSDGLFSTHATRFIFAGDFTFDHWAKWTTVPITFGGFYSPFESAAGVRSAQHFSVFAVASGEIQVSQGSGGAIVLSGGSGLNDGSYHHIAVTRSGSTIRLYLDGVHVDSDTNSAQWGNSTGMLVGENRAAEPNAWFQGQMDCVRFTTVARWTGTGSFTPPTSASDYDPFSGSVGPLIGGRLTRGGILLRGPLV